ncbi:MAG TPA: putative zinc-binding metallopeptidase [Vicinamibacteria bacterium]|nr:putative zinc-binding metallopeptidase [Vicinamibacteria bacterium]
MKDWASLTDEELLGIRFRDLELDVAFGLLSKALSALSRELSRRDIEFRPHVWLGEEWFCPDGVPGFAAPFYLAHPRLMQLERRQMFEVEGGTFRSCLRLMRHETGHAIDNAYRLRLRRQRRRLFGSSEEPYPEFYAPRPFSRRFVRHLEFGYAQAHPDEDFAETFAVWLDPGSRWRERYQDWPALEKLDYMDQLMKEVARREPLTNNRRTPEKLASLRRTLRTHYRRKKIRYQVDFSQHYDADLHRLFGDKGRRSASDFLRRHRTALRHQVSRWTGIHGYTVDQVLKDWITRSRATGLRVSGNEHRVLRDATVALTVRAMQYLQSGHYEVAL